MSTSMTTKIAKRPSPLYPASSQAGIFRAVHDSVRTGVVHRSYEPPKQHFSRSRVELNVQAGSASQARGQHFKALVPQNRESNFTIHFSDGRFRIRLAYQQHIAAAKKFHLHFGARRA